MVSTEMQEVTDKTINNGGILAKLYFDMQSKDQSELQPLMADLVNNRLLKTPGVIYGFGSIDEPIKLDDIFSTNAIVTVLFNDLGALINVVFNFSPIGLEILKPEGKFVIKVSDLNTVMISLSEISSEYSKYILTRVLSKEELEKVNKDLEARKALGKRLIEKDQSGKAPKEEPSKD
jgi:hypothetical protein